MVTETASWEFRAGEPENFLAAPAPNFFFKRLRLLIFPQAAPAPGIFFERLDSGSKGLKNPAPAPDYWLSLAKYSIPAN